MSWSEDMGYDCFDPEDFVASQKYWLSLVWFTLTEHGCIWEDKNGRHYKPEEISDSHLINIIRFCKRNWRPKEQVEALKKLAMKRGLKWI